MTGDNKSQNISIGGNVSQSVVAAGNNNTITQQIELLGEDKVQTQLKDLLQQLQAAIETEPNLNAEQKEEALAEVKELAVAGQSAQDGPMKKAAKRAITVLKGMTIGVGETTKFVEACNGLLPAISLLFGL